MIRRLILLSTAIVAGTLSFASQSQAAPSTGEVDFNGIVPGQCTFFNSKNGTVALNGDYTLGSNPDRYSGGATGHIDLACSAAAVLTVADPQQISGPTTTKNVAVVYTNAGNLNSSQGNFAPKSVALAAGFAQSGINVDVDNTSTTKIFAGNYAYKVLLTATPN
jgi:hypothetical protein